jgi:hypothetical protein
MGRLHPGARVGVLPYEVREAPIAVPVDNSMGASDVVAYVDRTGLGPEPKVPEPRLPHGRGRSRRMLGRFACGGGLDSFYNWFCKDMWFPAQDDQPSQYVRGIEVSCPFSPYTLDIDLDQPPSWYGPRSYQTTFCFMHTVSRRDGASFLIEPGDPPRVVDRIPEGLALPALPEQDPLKELIDHSGLVFWLILTEFGPTCEAWQFHPVSAASASTKGTRPVEARLTRLRPIKIREGDFRRNAYPATYEPAGEHRLPMLALGEERRSRGYTYTLLAVLGDELRMTAQFIWNELVAYDPGDAERWFLSRSACEAARGEVAEALERDGMDATQLGFHIREE